MNILDLHLKVQAHRYTNGPTKDTNIVQVLTEAGDVFDITDTIYDEEANTLYLRARLSDEI